MSLHIIVPTEFRGLIKIVKDQSGSEIRVEDGAYVYRIPTNGVLRVKETKGFAKWHRSKASFSNGAILPVYPDAANGTVALFEIGSSSSGKAFLFVGTESEKKNAMKDSFHLLR